jgi:hypothetical protein
MYPSLPLQVISPYPMQCHDIQRRQKSYPTSLPPTSLLLLVVATTRILLRNLSSAVAVAAVLFRKNVYVSASVKIPQKALDSPKEFFIIIYVEGKTTNKNIFG